MENLYVKIMPKRLKKKERNVSQHFIQRDCFATSTVALSLQLFDIPTKKEAAILRQPLLILQSF